MLLGLHFYLRLWRRSRPYDPRTGKRAGGVMRVIAYALCVSLVLGLVAAKKAQADSTEAMMGLSKDLLALQDIIGDGKELKINGETIHAAVGPSPDSVRVTLDRFQKHCEENPGVLGQEWARIDESGMLGDNEKEVPAQLPAHADTHVPQMKNGVVKMGVFRSGNDEEGIVMCLVRSENGPSDLALAMEQFTKTQDLGALGKMRYAFAKKSKKGTSLMTAWTDEHFSFKALAPNETGDAPGTDSAIVPRLAESQRILSADVQGTSYSVRVYNAPGTVAQAVGTYDTAMHELGFSTVHSENDGERGYLREGLFITMAVQPSGTGVTVSVAELGSNTGTAAGGPVPTLMSPGR